MRTVSQQFVIESQAQESGAAFLPLVTLDHASWDAPLRLVPNHEPVVHQGETFVPFGFQMTLPDDEDEGLPVLRWSADAVDQELVRRLRAVTGPITASVVMVLSSQPDVADIEYPDLEIRAVEYDAATVSGVMSIEPILDQPMCRLTFTPSTAPALF